MNRRGFLSAILAAGAAPAIVRAASLMPWRAIALPTTEEVLAVAGVGGSLLSIEMITREALRVAHQNMAFIGTVNGQFDRYVPTDTIKIRVPRQYAA